MDADQLDLLHRLIAMLSTAKSIPYALARIETIVPPESDEADILSPLLGEVKTLHQRMLERENLTEVGWYGFTDDEQHQARGLVAKLQKVCLTF